MAQALPFIVAGLAGLTAVSQLQAGKAQAKGLMQQAAFKKVQAKSEALKYKQQGVNVLDNILSTQATINARAGAGGIDPFSGSARSLQQLALAKGATEKYLTDEGFSIQIGMGDAQAQQYASQAKSAMATARTQAFSTLFSAAAGQMAMGGAPGGGNSFSGIGDAPGTAMGTG
jgi:hypothetical protein